MTARQQDDSREAARFGSRLISMVTGVLVAFAALCAVSSSAFAGVGVAATPTFPTPVTVGATNVPASLTVTNTSTPPESTGTVSLCNGPSASCSGPGLLVTPSCGSNAAGQNCPAASADPGVFQLSSTGTGEAGTACAGVAFTISVVDQSTGQVAFASSTAITLGPPGGPAATCVVDYTASVLKSPVNPLAGNPQTTVDAVFARGFSNLTSGNGSGVGTTHVTVNQASVPVFTQVSSSSVALGGTFTDSATFSPPASAPVPTGTVTFKVYANDPSCSGAFAFSSVNTLSAAGTNAVSNTFTPTSPGTYRVIASYSGDANYTPATTTCTDPNEAVVVNKGTLPITTQVTPTTITLGSSFHDTATLGATPPGAPAPTGTVQFNIYGPNNSTCTGATTFTSVSVVAGATVSSANFTPNAAGTYRVIAAYSGDANYNASGPTACSDPGESVVVSKATPTVATTASGPVAAGSPITDTAALVGGTAPTGTITFTVFGPNNATCTGAPVFTSTVAVNAGNGNYTSGPFTPAATGTYRWIAAYSGDASNVAVTTACNAAGETSVVNRATPAIVTTASPPVALGGQISDTATLSGGSNPTGTIVFTLFGPNNATCTGAAIFTSTVAVAGNGTYPSAPFTATAAGTYRWIAAYSGDANNNAVLSPCNAPSESVVVNKVTPTVVTQASPTVKLGTGATITDTATLAGATTPTGTITFTLFGPNNSSCSGAAIFTSTVAVNAGNGNYTSGAFTPTAAGTYRWIAAYSGDANNAAVTTSCNDANESVVVAPATPTIVTNASGPATTGGSITDTATLAGGTAPTGTITFTLFGPNNATCTGAAASTSTVAVSGNGTYQSAPFTATAAGTYRWVAAYSGDANNSAVVSPCNAGGESVVVGSSTVAITTQVSAASVPLGSSFQDTASVTHTTGAPVPTGTVTFNVYGPNNATCTGAAALTSSNALNVAGTMTTSSNFMPTAAGTYRVVATYSGDQNYVPVTTSCNDANESVLVNGGPPTVTTGAATSVTSTEEKIQGSVNPNGSQTSYTVEYGQTMSFGSISTVQAGGSGSTTFTGQVADVTGLAPNATYYYRLVATSAIGTATGTVMNFTTSGPGTKPVVTTGAASSITGSGATLSGTISPGGLQTSFTFEYGKTTAFGAITAVNALSPSGVLQTVTLPVSGLQPNTFYVYRLVASNSAGTTSGPVMGFTTTGP